MDLLSERWNRFVQFEDMMSLLTEGLGDIGLSEEEQARIVASLSATSERTNAWFGRFLKSQISIVGVILLEDRARYIAAKVITALVAYNKSATTDPITREQIKFYEDVLSGSIKRADNYKNTKKMFKSFFGLIEKKLQRENPAAYEVIKTQTRLLQQLEDLQDSVFPTYIDLNSSVVELLNADEKFLVDINKKIKSIRDEAEEDGNTISASTIARKANKEARLLLQAREDEGQVVMRLDDGFYWYNTQTANCPVEARLMSHCGATLYDGVLVSLRRRGKGKFSDRFVTLEYEEGDNLISQIKGFVMNSGEKMGNRPPPRFLRGKGGQVVDLWDMIAKFIDYAGVTRVTEDGLYTKDPGAFSEMLTWLDNNTQADVGSPRNNLYEELVEIRDNEEGSQSIFQFDFNMDEAEPTAIARVDRGQITFDYEGSYLEDFYDEEIERAIKEFIETATDNTFNVTVRQVNDTSFLANLSVSYANFEDYSYIRTGEDFTTFIDTVHSAEYNIPDIDDIVEYLVNSNLIVIASPAFQTFVMDQGARKLESLEFVEKVNYYEEDLNESVQVHYESMLVGPSSEIYDSLSEDFRPRPRLFYEILDRILNITPAYTVSIIGSLIDQYNRSPKNQMALPIDFEDKGPVVDDPGEVAALNTVIYFYVGDKKRGRPGRPRGQTTMSPKLSNPSELEPDEIVLKNVDRGALNILMKIRCSIEPEEATEDSIEEAVEYITFLNNNIKNIAEKTFDYISKVTEKTFRDLAGAGQRRRDDNPYFTSDLVGRAAGDTPIREVSVNVKKVKLVVKKHKK